MAASESFEVTLDLTEHGLGVSIVGGTDAPARAGRWFAFLVTCFMHTLPQTFSRPYRLNFQAACHQWRYHLCLP